MTEFPMTLKMPPPGIEADWSRKQAHSQKKVVNTLSLVFVRMLGCRGLVGPSFEYPEGSQSLLE